MRTTHVISKSKFMEVIASKFGSLAMLLGIAGVDTRNKLVRERVGEIETSRDPIKIVINYKSFVWVLWVGEGVGIKKKQPMAMIAEKHVDGTSVDLLTEVADGKRS